MTTKVKQAALQSNGVVSLWLGNFASELEFDDYTSVSKQFNEDFGFEVEREADSGGEYALRDEAQEIPQLLEKFFRSSTFIEAATRGARNCGWTKAKTALIFHHLKYNPNLINPNRKTPLTFIGTFSYGDQ